ncbi:serine protease [Pusillimonas sp. T7-7]|uniref:autotransporter domain-containing protein n=1 Tax=Pusillimonas sp. (strain T7-7) TaxID=1007105 RepID=UPI0002084835|nr:autotransporter domain-containing protein [Pusillimonas sp. T7-7]AEC18724.1 serine protease [Pusillimonas sp. T7-7]
MNKIYCKVWSKVRNAMVVASELARGAGKGKNGGARTSARSRRLNAVVVAVALGGGAGMAQAADVPVDADGSTETLNATDTYIKITASNGGIVDANGNAVTILGNDPSSEGSGVVVLTTGGQLVLDGGGTLDNINTVDESHGLFAEGDDTSAMLSGVAISTKGDKGRGIDASENSSVDMVGGHITTEGNGSSHGVLAIFGARVTLTDGVVITTKGSTNSFGLRGWDSVIDMSGGSIATVGAGATGVQAGDGATIKLTDGVKVTTTGAYAAGVSASGDSDVTLSGGSIVTKGQNSHGVTGIDSFVTLKDKVAITTEGSDAVGIQATGNANMAMAGGSVTTHGSYGYGATSGNNSTIALTGVAITTMGGRADGLSAQAQGHISMAGGSITAEGSEAAGAVAVDQSRITLTDGVAITTNGDWATGIVAEDDASVTMSGGTISTVGVGAKGAQLWNNSTLSLVDVSITTTGADANGLLVVNDASAHLNRVTMDTAGASIARNLNSSGLSPQPILVANSDLTQNNGVLLAVTGSNLTDPTVLQLTDGTRAAGDITDVSTNNRNTLALASGSQWTGVSRLDGNLTLTDAGTATHGGTVAAPIQVSGDVIVSNGAALGGNLNVGGMLSGSSGALRPGNSIGTQTFASAGSFTGDYHAEVNAAGQSDLISVTSGNFDLTGTNLYVDEADGNGGYKLDHDYTIVTTGDATGISGVANNEFANGGELEGSLAKSLVKLDPVIYGDDVVKIRLSIDQAKQLTLTDNQDAVLTAAGTNPAVQQAAQMDNYADALDHLSGEIHASTQTALLDTGNLMQRTLVNRMRGNSGSPSCANTAGSDQDRAGQAAACGLDYPLWAQVVGSWNHHDGDSNTASTRYRLGGLYLGGDKTFDSGWRVGGAVGFTDGKINADDRDSNADVKSYTAALYGGKGWALSKGQLNLLMGAGYTYHDIDTDRDTNVLGSQSLSAGYHANSTLLFAELGYALPVSDATYVEPYLNLGWTDLRTKGFSESGGSTALKADSDHNQIFTQTLGLRSTTAFTAGKTDISLLAGLGWRHASGDLDATRTMAFSQGGGESFEIKGAPIAKNAAVLDLGAEARLGENTALGLSYSGQFSSHGNDNTGSLYLRMKF